MRAKLNGCNRDLYVRRRRTAILSELNWHQCTDRRWGYHSLIVSVVALQRIQNVSEHSFLTAISARSVLERRGWRQEPKPPAKSLAVTALP